MTDLTDFAVADETPVAADIDRVWALVSDIALPTRFSPELRRVEWLDGAAGPVPGARFAGYNSHPRLGDWRTVCEIVACAPPREFGWAVLAYDGRYAGPGSDVPQRRVLWHFTLAPAAADGAPGGGTALGLGMRLTGAQSGLHAAVDRAPERTAEIVAWRRASLRDSIAATLAGIRDLAERG
ncbi:hypothetical protein GCM10010123_25530 [Pilimelia anulata]|uniref:SRPBCC family protein n=1 Tax=Pilimelia anulata TaxID=53371 RepID=A0A8J3FB12_9ACTN|nr:SRPBCC family protein [Pilimelia anulata]GGJ94587.1 hypothetical protein GCM10010123_25530 [Pilimelia anulata]